MGLHAVILNADFDIFSSHMPNGWICLNLHVDYYVQSSHELQLHLCVSGIAR